MNLLIVNDMALNAETLKSDMNWQQYNIDYVYTAYDVNEAKKCIQDKRIDLMLCDIEMPEENGIDLLKWIREKNLDIECVFLTCHASFEYAKEAIQYGCQEYILSPAKYEEIGEVVYKVSKRIEEKREATHYQEYGKQHIKEKVGHAVEEYGHLTTEKLLEEVLAFITANISSESLSVNEIAEHFYTHPVSLNRNFKKKKGISISQYIIKERMALAAEYLRSGQIGANIVAELVGYQSYASFNLMFKKFYGCTPSQFQEENH